MTTLTETTVRLIASPRSWIEGEALRQLYATARLDGMTHAVGLPDLHAGKGHPIGAAFLTEGILYPHLVGSDIGCGTGLWKSDLLRRKARLDRWSGILRDLEHPWEGDVAAWSHDHGLPSSEFDPALGTIGGGNHFAELQAVEKIFDAGEFKRLGLEREQLVMLVHSGSRGLGDSILRAHVSGHHAGGVSADTVVATDYLRGHDHAVLWAQANRALIARRFLEQLGASGEGILDGCHNSVTRRDTDGATAWLHRKGAAPADEGAMVIPGSRGTLSYLVLPQRAAASTGWSIAHGAGRKWTRRESRARMRERFGPEQLTQTGLGSRVICENRDLLYEEAPPAYKPIESVISDLAGAGLLSVIATLRPLITYKTRALRR